MIVQLQFSTLLVSLIVGTLLPLLVTAVTKSSASPFIKRLVLGVLAGIGAVVTAASTYAGHTPWRQTLLSFATVFLTAIGSYFGLWRGSDAHVALDNATANVGIGGPPTTPTDPQAGITVVELCVIVIAAVAVIAFVIAAFGNGIHVHS